MNIGIDIDGVLTDFQRETMDYGAKMCVEEKWPININEKEYWEVKAFNWTEEQRKKFWDKYFVKYLEETSARTFAAEVIEKLQQEGNNIVLITARTEEDMPPEDYGKMQQITKDWLKAKNIKYDKIIFEKEKMQPCIENNIDVMIEDSPKNIEKLSKQIKVIKFDCQYNKDVNNENITTAYSWYHIYNIIKEMKGE